MEDIDIYSGDKVISRVIFGDAECGAVAFQGLAAALEPYAHVFAVADAGVLGKSSAAQSLAVMLENRNVPLKAVQISEECKTMDSVMEICSWLMDCGADRDALVLAIGGGITTDMAGFAASIYKRGLRFAYVPTTLLAQVDAAVGGKTGVNFRKYKNMLGLICQPEFAYADTRMLDSLPYRDFLSGAAEMLKAFIISDNGNYSDAVEFLKGLDDVVGNAAVSQNGDPAEHLTLSEVMMKSGSGWPRLSHLIAESIKVKAGIVSRDQFESGERRKLNLGHTFAHAIETLARRGGDDITHGEAVAVGIVMAASLAGLVGTEMKEPSAHESSCADIVSGGPCDGKSQAGTEQAGKSQAGPGSGIMAPRDCALAARLEKDFVACGLPVRCPYDIRMMAEAMSKDKKAEGGKVHFVLPFAVGKVMIVDLSVAEACAALNESGL